MMSHAVPAPLGEPRHVEAAWNRWLLGSKAITRKAIVRWASVVHCYIVGLTALYIGAAHGLASERSLALLAAYCAFGMGGFYVVMRSGAAARLRDPWLTFPITLFSASAIVLSYWLTELSRGASLQFLFLLVVFNLLRLTQRQTQIVTWGSVAMLAGLLIYRLEVSGAVDGRKEIFNIAMAAVMLPVLSVVAREVRRLRQRQIEQRASLETALERLHALSLRDALTGLYNRRHITSLLEQEGHRQTRTTSPFCVAMLDLDWFKQINDRFGHRAGDDVLCTFSCLASETLRTTDALGRWGGEEFLVVLPGVGATAAAQALDRLREAVLAHNWTRIAPTLRVTFSAGVCEHHVGDSIERTLERADQALYEAKTQGRDRVAVAGARSGSPA